MSLVHFSKLCNSLKLTKTQVSFFLTLTLFTLSYALVGWWTESYQHMYDTAISGEFTNQMFGTAHNPFPEYMPGGAKIFNALEKIYPIRWIAFFLLSLLFTSIWILYYQILKFTETYTLVSRIVLVLFFSLLFYESVVLYHMVRISMFMGIAALSGLLINEKNSFISKKMLPYLVLFILALWLRGNIHLFLLTFLTGAFILHKKSMKPLLLFWIAMGISLAHYTKTVFLVDTSKDLNTYFLYDTEFKLHHTGNYSPNLNLPTFIDTLKYTAIKQDILADEINLPPSYYEQIGIFTNLNKFSSSQISYAKNQFLKLLPDNYYFILADLILILLYVFFGGNQLKHYKLKTTLLFIFFYSIIFAVSFIKMENRFLVPFQVFFLLVIISLHQPNLFKFKKYAPIIIGFLLFIAPFIIYYSHKKINIEKQNTLMFENAFTDLQNKYKDNIIVINTGFITQNKPYETFFQKNYFKSFYLYNYFALQFHPLYRPYLEKECACNVGNLYSFYDYLIKSPNNVIYLDEPKRMEVLMKYLNVIYSKSYVAKEIGISSLYGFKGSPLHIFQISDFE